MSSSEAASRPVSNGRDLDILTLIARLPLISAHQLEQLVGDPAVVYQRLKQARRRGLVATVGCLPRGVGRPAELLRVTPRGGLLLAKHAISNGIEPIPLSPRRGVSPHQLATLVACYELLAELACAGGNCAEVIAWEQPWQRAYQPASRRRPCRVRLPAAATLAWSRPVRVSRSYLLLPDLGGTEPATWQSRLADLVRLQQAYGEDLPALAIVTTSEARASAWRQALALASANNGDDSLDRWTVSIADTQPGLPVLKGFGQPRKHRTREPLTPLGARDLELLNTLGRHPFLTASLLATLLGQDHRWLRARMRHLVARKLVRVVLPAELGDLEPGTERKLELTRSGMVAVAARLGLPPATAVRVHALAGGGPEETFGPRQTLLVHAAHTRGADRVMVGLAASARVDRRRAYLAEWRNAAACAHGRLRPDAYGLLHLHGHDCGFFLEFDRATMRPAELRAKFLAYHRFRASRRAAQLYTSFPTVLVVTTGPGAERRLARAVSAVDTSFVSPLPVLLTTTAWIEAHAGGMLGPIWRATHGEARRSWPRLTTGIAS